ncbi:TonB-dependent receptor domain-containing protein [Shewanella sp. NIFS-20-20]|uniref:TonB-dependent receptor domain-containing protein n=1 Tax=Shewanella sp. NIFS-20-20 TaxID=2853806 RepID=UPI001C470FBC|nr:TonB-dependent receptor [Shewanella sp. NIFS-20-20]MBV7314160.1 TonB-dependent receptor [Shewanella sp. NIFS-20-20]
MFKVTRMAKAIHLGILSSSLAFGGIAFAAEEENKEEKVERIEVTGSRINRTDLETAQPIVVLTAEDMKNEGFSTAFDALQGLSQNTGTVQGNEFGAQGGFTPNADVIDLRGFGPGYTLVLLNGRRIAENPTPYNGQSNFVNLSGIPFAAIDRIEIVTAGASAIYGSDAVAGVVNIILKKDIDSTTASAMFGTTKDGGGDQQRFSITSGTTGANYSIGGTLEFYKQDPIYSRDRDFMDSVEDNPAGPEDLSRGILQLDAFSGLYRDPGEQACADSGSGYEYASRGTRGYYCGVDTTGDRTIRNERKNTTGYVFGTYDINDDLQLFADGMYTTIDSAVYGSRHFYSEYLLLNTPDGSGNFAGGTRDYVLNQRIFNFNEMGQRTTEFNEDVYNFTVGLKGSVFSDYQWQAYYSESRYDFKSSRDWMKEEKVTEMFLGEIDNPYGLYNGAGKVGLYDSITPEVRDQLIGTQIITGDSYARTFSADINGDLFELPAGMVGFAAVVEYNKQGYSLVQDERTLNQDGMGWQGLTGTEGGGDRSRYAVGVEFLVPVLEGLDLGLAGRYDKYDDDTTDVGGRLSPSVSLTYQPIDELKFRGNWGQSFRAPDMHYVFAGNSGFYSNAYDWTSCRRDDYGDDPSFLPTESACDTTNYQGSRSGSLTLKEEKGTSWGLGVIVEPTENLNMSFDFYDIKLEDLISDESAQTLLDLEYDCNYSLNGKSPDSAECVANAAKIQRVAAGNPGAGNIESINVTPENKALYQQRGLDAQINYSIDTEYGDWGFNLGWTHILNTRYQANADAEVQELRDDKDNSEPRSKTNLTVSWNYQDWQAAIRGDRVGSIPIWNQPSENYDPETGDVIKVDRLRQYFTVNMTVGYQFNDNLRLQLIGENIFNERPQVDVTHDSWPYYNSFAYPGAAIGASYRAEVTYRF